MAAIPPLENNALEAICGVIADTASGLTGTEIGNLLASLGIEDVSPGITKRRRLFSALATRQNQDRCSNNVFAFIQGAMDPIRYTRDGEAFEARRSELNVVLALKGYQLGPDGKIRTVTAAATLSEAQQKASALRKKLSDRRVHAMVLAFCKPELLHENYFHAVFEATKSIADRLRELSSLDEDGNSLAEHCFGGEKPRLAINSLQTKTERNEQTGFVNLLKGIFGMFRNTTAHEPKVKWAIEESDALDLLSMVSFAHRKLDNTARTGF